MGLELGLDRRWQGRAGAWGRAGTSMVGLGQILGAHQGIQIPPHFVMGALGVGVLSKDSPVEA